MAITNSKKGNRKMKKYSYIYMLAMAGVLMTSCQDDFVEGTITRPAEVGDVILFGASANFENANPNVRTEYSGEEVDGKESIWWVPNKDRVQIYCAEAISASDDHSAHYVVKGDAQSTGKDNASTTDKVEQNYLERLHESSLQWGEGSDANGTHTFYGMYPSQFMFRNDDNSTAIDPTLVEGITMSGTIVKGYVHNEQIASAVTKNGNNYVAKPDMRYAYMVAKTSTTRQQAITETNGVVQGVSLNFYPLVTALEVTLALPTSGNEATVNPVTIGRVSVSATDVAGSFSADLSAWDGASAYTTNATTGTSKLDEIYMRINYTDANGLTMPVTLKAGESLTFTVFLKPTANVDNIKIGFASDLLGQTTKYKELGSKDTPPAGIQVRKKNVISNLRLPVSITNEQLNYSKWMQQLPDETLISGISMPGSGNSFSYGTTITTNKQYYQSQNLNFGDQWKAGIRAFEIVTDRANNTSGSDFEDLVLQCGKADINESTRNTLTVTEAVGMILDSLENNNKETAMAIFTYQPEGSSPNRRGYAYMAQFVNFINQETYKGKLVLFQPGLKLQDARGKLMVVVRPNSNDEGDYYKNGSIYSKDDSGQEHKSDIWAAIVGELKDKAKDYTVVLNGCGTGKDKWGARGFKIKVGEQTQPARDISNWNGSMSNPSNQWWIEQYMYAGNNSNKEPLFNGTNTEVNVTNNKGGQATIYRAPLNTSNPTEDLNFAYETNHGFSCWFQEWQRVLSADIYQAGGNWSDGRSTYGYEGIKWFESYNEKLSNAKTTFDMAVSGNYKNYVFINSLCGYLAKDNDPEESVIPSVYQAYGGGYGDIKALADKINPDFYAYVNERIKTAVAPTGIVFMDFVSNTPTKSDGTADPAYWLPQLIIQNNDFKDNITIGGQGEGVGGGTGGNPGI